MQKPTKAFADMVLELADNLEAVLNEMYPDGHLVPVFVSPESLRASARDITQSVEHGGHDFSDGPIDVAEVGS
ncbi:Uncharacterised protein [Mycobacteroides abscessus subsp. massiliense]|uniref:hypothetical protein n=1 Tax=Mycobacteroides abscessus TaxID=36809 RepID=UPI0009A7C5F4|nr:hypothetical protein [Mycobacteroides abscessus]SKG32349.1 Uncharacterised protein [Mycobacteroides abscessus subsp. massiliense]SKH69698.1 Uncharacterised protein [Mycobacteroides abscessus subsp. massiliense]SKJ13191.1 Uncharacterised protein [Mycobacteroides abscessus subsp. massiliense]SKK57335.1 Uncharacterised protein [Mycobacteroides abscessus subsp. massiliense]SKL62387.1 Uncharacterised protein [Mycobacteroides abscessus subsp. massiliense]